jgi:hypothetical protein
MTVTTLCCVQDFGIFVLLMNTVASYVSGFVLVMVPAYGEHLKAPPWVFLKKRKKELTVLHCARNNAASTIGFITLMFMGGCNNCGLVMDLTWPRLRR